MYRKDLAKCVARCGFEETDGLFEATDDLCEATDCELEATGGHLASFERMQRRQDSKSQYLVADRKGFEAETVDCLVETDAETHLNA
ncbi:hypothetical protein AAVH_21549 [Aphelenchoides avenae]|nr:hypothetical protein AAVH_21549 [Aphelenchus avenae]